jgi:hypothetical protein
LNPLSKDMPTETPPSPPVPPTADGAPDYDEATLEMVATDPLITWIETRDEAALKPALQRIEPKINSHLHRHGLGTDPLAKTQARVYAAQALRSYSPEHGASFDTWLDRSMQQLGRFRRLRSTAVHVPERIQMDAMKIERARRELEDTLGRDPDLDELADAAGVPIRRIDQVRKGFRKMTSETVYGSELPAAQSTDWLGEALDMTWDEAGKQDRQIIEMKTGYGGRYKPMTPKDIAAKLNISPVDLSRRSARLGAKIEEIIEELER